MRTTGDATRLPALPLEFDGRRLGLRRDVPLPDADREAAIDNAMTAVFLHSGQVCSAGARLLVEESVAEEVVDTIVEAAETGRIPAPPRPRNGGDRPPPCRSRTAAPRGRRPIRTAG